MKIKITELLGHPGDSDVSSDSDQDVSSDSVQEETPPVQLPINPLPSQSIRRGREANPAAQLDKILAEINQCLDSNQPVNLDNYPPLYIVHYRGVNFYAQFFTQKERRRERQNIGQLGNSQPLYAPALYQLAGLEIGQPLTLNDHQRLKKANQELQESFVQMEQARTQGTAWFGNKRLHATEAHRHYQRFVNNYEEFREESQARFYSTYRFLPKAAKVNPYISTADEARHAVFYALGGKAELNQGVLRPCYLREQRDRRQNGRAKHPKVGYVQIVFHTLDSFARENPYILSSLEAANAIDIGRQLHERETTFKGQISSEHIVHTKIVRYPSFNQKFLKNYHSSKYGIDASRSFTSYKKSILGENNVANTILLEKIAEHYIQELEKIAENISRQRQGFIVYLGLDGRLRRTLPTTIDISNARSNKNAMALLTTLQKNLQLFTRTPQARLRVQHPAIVNVPSPASVKTAGTHKLINTHTRLVDSISIPNNQSDKEFESSLKTAMVEGLDINQLDSKNGRTLLHYAIVHNRQAIANILVTNGAILTVRSGSGKNAADYGSEYHHEWVATLTVQNPLVERLARLTIGNTQTRPNLRSAPIPIKLAYPPRVAPILFIQENRNIVQLPSINHPKLVDDVINNRVVQEFESSLKTAMVKGLDINQLDSKNGRTLLHYAIVHNRQAITNILVANGASLTVRSGSGKNAADYGSEYHHEWVATLRTLPQFKTR